MQSTILIQVEVQIQDDDNKIWQQAAVWQYHNRQAQ